MVTTTVGRPWRRVGTLAWSRKWRQTATSPLARRSAHGSSRSPSLSAAASTATWTHSAPSVSRAASTRVPAAVGVNRSDIAGSSAVVRCSSCHRSTARATSSTVWPIAAATSADCSAASAPAARPSSAALARTAAVRQAGLDGGHRPRRRSASSSSLARHRPDARRPATPATTPHPGRRPPGRPPAPPPRRGAAAGAASESRPELQHRRRKRCANRRVVEAPRAPRPCTTRSARREWSSRRS